ncbi:MAG: N-acetylmuramoyl-L-alanine amidase [Alphaproteobacteria bacterium]|nr:N-acetylmuramoyl-L-alanine amidase [Alphaproteobacteria bacterium]
MKIFSKALTSLFFWGILFFTPSAVYSHTILGIRMGDHPSFTRLVLDVQEAPSFKVTVSKDCKQIRLFGPQLKCQKKLPQLPKRLVKSLGFSSFRTGVGEFKFDMAFPIKIMKSFTLSPSKATPYFRYIIDIQKNDYCPEKKAPPPQTLLPKKKVIVIDPGHGGKDSGARGRKGIQEKDVTLKIATILQTVLAKNPLYDVRLTRHHDVFLSLPQRVNFARDAKADFFISLHADSHPRPDTRGLSVYTLSKVASDAEAEKLAIKENKVDLIEGVDLSDHPPEVANILIDLMKRETMNLSRQAANYMVSKLRKRVLLLRNTIRSANFAVLRTPDLPAILIEMGYISNKQDEKLLTTYQHQIKLCEGIKEGVDSYFIEHDRS